MPSKQLANNTYQKLLEDIAGIYDRALKDVHLAVEAILKTAYWKIGERIVEVEQDGDIHAEYGSHLLEDISKDLTKTNRKGFSVTNLKNMRLVYQTFSIRQLTDELTWTHYVALSTIKDKKERQAYLKRSVEKKWTVEQLEDVLIRDQVKKLPSGEGAAKVSALPVKGKIPRLVFKRGILNTYRVEENPPGEEDDAVWIDCGFRISRRIKPVHKGSLKAGDVVALSESKTADNAVEVKKMTAKDFRVDSVLYTYAARPVKVIDGDTIKVDVKLGETLATSKKLRLRRINTPEVETPEGKKAKEFVQKRLKNCPWIVIKTYSTDIYDRYLVDIFYLEGCDDPAKIALEGNLLNQELLDEGLAELWRAPDPLDLAMMN